MVEVWGFEHVVLVERLTGSAVGKERGPANNMHASCGAACDRPLTPSHDVYTGGGARAVRRSQLSTPPAPPHHRTTS